MVDILMSTYNGERYLDAQLQSLFTQDREDFSLIIRDDASTDSTEAILEDWRRRYPDRIELVTGMPHTGQPGLNFLSLLKHARSAYTMYCDQDDVWASNKVSLSLAAMHEAENQSGGIPVLVHTDLAVVDSSLQPIAESFAEHQNLNPEFHTLPRLIAQNNVTGCTVMVNRALRTMLRTPSEPILHDWWTALAAAAFGRIVYLNTPTVYYRQHAANTVGAKKARGLSRAVDRAVHLQDARAALRATYAAARLFADTYSDLLSADQISFLDTYAALHEAPLLKRWSVLRRHKAFKNGLLRAAAQVLIG